MTIKVGQRWFLNTICHKFIVEINILSGGGTYGSGKIIQMVNRASTCSLGFVIGNEYNVVPSDSDWEYLRGQDAP